MAKPMTTEERITAGAREAWSSDWDEAGSGDRVDMRKFVVDVLRAAVPELFTDPPTHWLAPWEATKAMRDACFDGQEPEWVFENMRTAHLNLPESPPA